MQGSKLRCSGLHSVEGTVSCFHSRGAWVCTLLAAGAVEYYADHIHNRNLRLSVTETLAVSGSERQKHNVVLESFSKANENKRRKIPIG